MSVGVCLPSAAFCVFLVVYEGCVERVFASQLRLHTRTAFVRHDATIAGVSAPSSLVANAAVATPRAQASRPKGVFVYKVHDAREASRSLCSLMNFFNGKAQYPVRIFADQDKHNSEVEMRRLAGETGIDLDIVVDHESWRELPATLSREEQDQILATCSDHRYEDKFTAETLCSTKKTPIGYIYMEIWRYLKMPLEPTLQQFDYFISLDADAYVTGPMSVDPFELMASNKLSGIFNIQAYQSSAIEPLQDVLASEFSVEERRLRFLDSPRVAPYWFDDDGKWGGSNFSSLSVKPRGTYFASIWGCFYGGRMDVLRSARYQQFAKKIVFYTYLNRLDEQPVIGAAWALLTKGTDVWYLPKHDVHLNIYHHGWIDNCAVVRDGSKWTRHCLGETGWHGFSEPHEHLLPLEEAWSWQPPSAWSICAKAPSKYDYLL